MPNEEIFILHYSHINATKVYFNWYLAPYSPTDTIATDTFYISYTNVNTSQTVVVDTGNVMNHTLTLSPNTVYTVVVYSINSLAEKSEDSNVETIATGEEPINYAGTDWYMRPYNADEMNQITIEELRGAVTVSATNGVIQNPEPTFISIVTPTSPKPFYQLYRIDPKGELFGNTPCGLYNFKKRTITL
jgi:hypothetical protein